jgi:hypothetical protein
MKRKRLAVLVVLSAPLVAGLLGSAFLTGQLQSFHKVYIRRDPVLEMPSALDLGNQERGKVVVARFKVANRGGSDLVLDQVRTSCICSGLEREVEGRFIPVASLRLTPGEETELAVRVAVRAQIGTEMRNAIFFHTNDPALPERALVVGIPKVTGGINASPARVLFDSIPIKTEAHQLIEIRDPTSPPRTIRQVLSSNPDRFTVRLLPAERAEGSPETKHKDGLLLGRIEVSPRTQEPGSFEGEVQIFLNDEARPPESIPVTGRVAPMVEASPATLVLPRASREGPLYFGTSVCRSIEGLPLQLSLEEAPKGISAMISPVHGNPSLQTVRIEWKPDAAEPSLKSNEQVVRFHARVGDRDTTVGIRLRLRPSS